jgi:hypothetical protein
MHTSAFAVSLARVIACVSVPAGVCVPSKRTIRLPALILFKPFSMFLQQHDATCVIHSSCLLLCILHRSSGASESTNAAEACSAHATAVSESCVVFAYRGVPWGVGVPDLCDGLIRSHPFRQVSGLEVHSRSPPAALHYDLFHTWIVNIYLLGMMQTGMMQAGNLPECM